jgi:hypothetical protein
MRGVEPNLPAGQGPLQAADVSPSVSPYTPSGQGVHDPAVPVLYVPATHLTGTMVPGGHAYLHTHKACGSFLSKHVSTRTTQQQPRTPQRTTPCTRHSAGPMHRQNNQRCKSHYTQRTDGRSRRHRSRLARGRRETGGAGEPHQRHK